MTNKDWRDDRIEILERKLAAAEEQATKSEAKAQWWYGAWQQAWQQRDLNARTIEILEREMLDLHNEIARLTSEN